MPQVLSVLALGLASDGAPVTLVRDGEPLLPVAAGITAAPVAALRRYLREISGAQLEVVKPEAGKSAIQVGLASDFPWASVERPEELSAEGFVPRTDGSRCRTGAARRVAWTAIRRRVCDPSSAR